MKESVGFNTVMYISILDELSCSKYKFGCKSQGIMLDPLACITLNMHFYQGHHN